MKDLFIISRWFPTIKWEPISSSECIGLDLSPMWSWEGLYFDWRGSGFLLLARIRK